MPDWLLFVIGVVLTVGTGFFVAGEFSLVGLDRADLAARVGRGEPVAKRLTRVLERTSLHLSGAQLGITLTTLLTGFTIEPAMTGWLAPAFASWGIAADPARVIAVVVSILIATILSMIVGELVPKVLSISSPYRVATVAVPFLVGFTWLLRPVVWVLEATSNGILRLLRRKPIDELSTTRSADELASLVESSAEELGEETAELLSRTLRSSDLTAADVMTARPQVDFVFASATAAEVVALAVATGHSRFPVAGEDEDGDEDVDAVVGVVHVKDAVAVPRGERAERSVADIMMAPAHRVPESLPLRVLLGGLRRKGFQLAVVIDEYGGTAGIATLEDLVEEFLGDVADEHDEDEPLVAAVAGGVEFPGLLRPDQLAEFDELDGVVIPEGEEYDTVAGWLMAELEKVPEVGDAVAGAPGAPGRFEVVEMDGLRIERIRWTPPEPEAGDDE